MREPSQHPLLHPLSNGNNGGAHHPLDDDPDLAKIGEPQRVVRQNGAEPVRKGILDKPEPKNDPEPVIRHTKRSLTLEDPTNAVADFDPMKKREIRSFNQQIGTAAHGDWKRPTNLTGTGATHCRSFHCKLCGDALAYLDQQVNEWLDEHPEYEVKHVNTTVGEFTGKLKEPHLIMIVWV